MSGAETEDCLQVEDQRFAIVPEWVIDLDVGDVAFRLYALLLRYGGSSNIRMPSRSTLARRLRRSVDTVDRAMRELEAAGAVVVERRRDGERHLTNRYHVRTSGPGRSSAATTPGRVCAARGSRTGAAGGDRSGAAPVAATARHDPEVPTESNLTQTEGLARRLRAERVQLGMPLQGWSTGAVARAVERAVARGWPPEGLAEALLRVARDADTRSPLRVAEAGSWWSTDAASAGESPEDLARCEQLLDQLDGKRVRLQQQARAQLAAEGSSVTRATVLVRAVRLAEGGGLRASGSA